MCLDKSRNHVDHFYRMVALLVLSTTEGHKPLSRLPREAKVIPEIPLFSFETVFGQSAIFMKDSPFWTYFEDFLSEEAKYLFERCEKEIPYQQWTYERDGKVGDSPRLSKFYRFGGADNPEDLKDDEKAGLPRIIGELAGIMNALMREEEFLQTYNIIPGIQFDSVLVHYYRSGLDYISDHSDREAGQTYIFGLSLGAERTLRFKCKKDKSVQFSYKLKSGSLYVMRPGCQELFTHGIPKITAKKQPGPRISLTFRHDNKSSNYSN